MFVIKNDGAQKGKIETRRATSKGKGLGNGGQEFIQCPEVKQRQNPVA